MKNNNEKVTTETGKFMEHVSDLEEKMNNRANKIDFKKPLLTENDLSELKLHLGYTRAYSDLAKVRLQYHKFGLNDQKNDDDDDE